MAFVNFLCKFTNGLFRHFVCFEKFHSPVSELVNLARCVKFNPYFILGIVLIVFCGTQSNRRTNFIPRLAGFNPRLALIVFSGTGAWKTTSPYHHLTALIKKHQYVRNYYSPWSKIVLFRNKEAISANICVTDLSWSHEAAIVSRSNRFVCPPTWRKRSRDFLVQGAARRLFPRIPTSSHVVSVTPLRSMILSFQRSPYLINIQLRRRCKFPDRKQSMPIFTVVAIPSNK